MNGGRPTHLIAACTLTISVLLGFSGFAQASAPAEPPGMSAKTPFRPDRPVSNHIGARPGEGPGGTEIRIKGYVAGGVCRFHGVSFDFVDANGVRTSLGSVNPGG